MSLFDQGQAAFQPESLTPARIGFSPVSVRFANLAPQDATTWSATSGTATVTTGISAPDATTDAATLTCPTSDRAYKRIYATERALTVGDWLVCGVYVKAASLTQGASQPTGTMQNYAAATLRILDDTEGYQIDIDGLNYRHLTAGEDADTTWQWITTAAKIELAPSGNSATVAFDLNCDPEHTVSFYAPTLWHIPADTLTDAEVQAQLLNFYPVPDAAEAGIVATLAGQSFQSKLRDAGGQVFNVRAFGAVGDGITNDTAAIQALIDEAAQSLEKTVFIPAGTFIADLVVPDEIFILGAGKGKTVLKSTGANLPVIWGQTSASRLRLRDLTIEGTSAGANQDGIRVEGASVAHIEVAGVEIQNVGGRGIWLNSPSNAIFSSWIEDVQVREWNRANVEGVAAIDVDSEGPCIQLRNCYVHSTASSATPIGYRIRRGLTRTILLENCNGIDPCATSGAINVIVGQDTAQGDATTSAAYCTFQNCNIEAFSASGIEIRCAGSAINLLGANNFVAATSGTRPLYYRASAPNISPGVLDPQTIFSQADSPTTYANGQPIHSNGHPPLIALAPAGSFGSFDGVTQFYDTSTSQVCALRRLDALNRVIATASRTQRSIGETLIEVQASAPTTQTLRWAGDFRQGEIVCIKDGSGNAATHNITVAALSGSKIDGASTRVISANYGALLLYTDGTDFKVLAEVGSAGITGSGTAANLMVWGSSNTATEVSGLAWDAGNNALKSAGRFYSGTTGSAGFPAVALTADADTGIYWPSSNVLGLTVGGNLRAQLDNVFSLYAYGASSGETGAVRLYNLAATGSVTICAHDTAVTHKATWPANNAAGVLTNDGSGGLSWISSGGGSGDVVGPSSAADNALARFDTTTGKLIQNSGLTLSDLSTSTYTLAVTAPSAASTSTAGYSFVSQASAAVAGTSTNGAAAGGDWSAIAGDAARLNTGDANGGNVYLTPGAKIGSGADGQVILGRVGTASVPALTWAGNLSSGISLINSGIQFSLSGTNNAAVNSNGFKVSSNGRVDWSSDSTTSGTTDITLSRFAANTLRIGGDTAGSTAGKLFVSRSDKTHTGWLTVCGDTANTSTVDNVGAIGLDSTGTAAAGLGAQLLLTLESSTTNQRQAAGMTWLWTTATDASRTADLFFSTVNSGSVAEAFRVVSSGAFRSAAISDPASPSNGDVWNSSARNCYSVRQSGQTEDLSTTMWRSSAASSFDTTAVATSLIADTGVGTKTLAANRLKVGNHIRITAGGLFGTKATSAGTFTLRVVNGSTTMLTTSAFTLPDGVFDLAWSVVAIGAVAATGTTGTITWRVELMLTDGSGLVYLPGYAINSTTINTTVTRALDITGQFSVSDADNYMQTDTACIEILA